MLVMNMTHQQLNYCLARIKGYKIIRTFDHQVMVSNKKNSSHDFAPCDNWAHAGDIIEEYGLNIVKGNLVDALRGLVIDKLGHSVQIPPGIKFA